MRNLWCAILHARASVFARTPQHLENAEADLVVVSKWPDGYFGMVRGGCSHSTDFGRSPASPASELHFEGAGAMTTDTFTA